MTGDRPRMSRERILEGASTILDSGQYTDLTVDALARSLHMSKSTLYKYFSSKEDVVVALVVDACDQADAEVERTLAGGTATEQLTELAHIIGRHGQNLPRAVLTQPERLPVACGQRLATTREMFANAAFLLVQRGSDRKEFTHPDPRVVAVAFVAAAQSVLADAARLGLEDYGGKLHYLPGLFLPSISAGAEPETDTESE
ncbi:MAG: TetR/AcrR family transcriptional regulator [Myxococcales bacterium]|nr:TetR/AcrR family transcriptional regulator [Myxococcales bacterium]